MFLFPDMKGRNASRSQMVCLYYFLVLTSGYSVLAVEQCSFRFILCFTFTAYIDSTLLDKLA